jgi:choline dehydrogenase-like flavoprotein
MNDSPLLSSPEELESGELDVAIIGSGPAGAATAERLHEMHPGARIAVLERGGLIAAEHLNNLLENTHRRAVIDRFKSTEWEGDFAAGGMMLRALGGRGIAAGAHLRRFDPQDFSLWPDGRWPQAAVDALPDYYREAEYARRVSISAIQGPAQMWTLGTLAGLRAYPPPIGVDLWSQGDFSVPRGYDSPAARLWELLLRDALGGAGRRLHVVTHAYVTQLLRAGARIDAIHLRSTAPRAHERATEVRAKFVVLAASPIESARLFKHSQVRPESTAAGCYLAEHVERRAKIVAAAPRGSRPGQGVSVVIPPPGGGLLERYQIHLRGELDANAKLVIDIGGFAAMDPRKENRVTLSEGKDHYGVPRAHVRLALSDGDAARTGLMEKRIVDIGRALGGTFVTEQYPTEGSAPRFVDDARSIQAMDPGRSYHEAGTLRMDGTDEARSVTDEFGQVRGLDNLYVADASLFPSVGVANPMLTITALAYRVADCIAARL